ncbi:class I SAM-dependent methyltransferase [Streptomyces sp. NPDC093094]|uniref:class I SAM-dependent methyltransferase n=1 Tax=Streptomyces sp. NPDC093094 TaxID=3366026 RepID=UPI00380D367A
MATPERRFDVWAGASAYERYMGRWSRPVAREFVPWCAAGEGLRWLDVGCGTGVLSQVVAESARPRLVLGADRSETFVAAARAGVHGPVRFAVADATALPVRAGTFDMAVAALVLNFLPDPVAAAAGMTRSVQPGGTVAAYVWDYADGMGFLRLFWDAAVRADPAAHALHEGGRFRACRPEDLRRTWLGAGLADVAVTGIEIPTVFTDFADLWEPFLAGQGPAPAYAASLGPAGRARVRDALAAAAPVRADGTVALTARAWAVRGRRPRGGPAGHGVTSRTGETRAGRETAPVRPPQPHPPGRHP